MTIQQHVGPNTTLPLDDLMAQVETVPIPAHGVLQPDEMTEPMPAGANDGTSSTDSDESKNE